MVEGTAEEMRILSHTILNLLQCKGSINCEREIAILLESSKLNFSTFMIDLQLFNQIM